MIKNQQQLTRKKWLRRNYTFAFHAYWIISSVGELLERFPQFDTRKSKERRKSFRFLFIFFFFGRFRASYSVRHWTMRNIVIWSDCRVRTKRFERVSGGNETSKKNKIQTTLIWLSLLLNSECDNTQFQFWLEHFRFKFRFSIRFILLNWCRQQSRARFIKFYAN